jgi:dephospho-CoA kinase
MLVVGLTGNYGMGKSRILSLFAKLGAYTLDSDKVVESLLMEKNVLAKIRGLMGDVVFFRDGSLNKEKVARLIFHDETVRYSLEDVLHPLVFERIDLLIKNIDRERIVVIEVPLLFERGYQKRFDRTVTVYSDEETALRRLEKSGIRRQNALMRLKSQLPIKEKMKRSDFIIDNSGSINHAKSQVEAIYKKLSTMGEHANH